MFKALDKRDNSDVVILDQQWLEAIDKLRELDHEDILICQGCRQPVRVRAGDQRREHFAHKHLINCNYSDESPILRNSRAVLYEWLKTKIDANVTIEKQVDGSELFRPIDCWVAKDSKVFAYWIIDSALKPEKRMVLQNSAENLGIQFHWVFCENMLRIDQDNSDNLFLSTTEREFIQHSKHCDVYSYEHSVLGGSLHYLDINNRKLVTYRNLSLYHKPNVFTGYNVNSNLDEVSISAETGEFVHKGEYEKLQKYEQEISLHHKETMISSTVNMTLSSPLFGKKKCQICGEMTDNWASFDGNTGLCKCMSCQRKISYENSR